MVRSLDNAPSERRAREFRASQAIRAGRHLTGDHVVEILDGLTKQRGKPTAIRVDSGPEFISKSLDWCAYFKEGKLDFRRPGTPTDNAFIKSFNGGFRQECLDQHWCLSLADARDHAEVFGLRR